jgi:hypothetical protein
MGKKSGFALSLLAFCGLLFFCVFAHADQRTNWIAFNGTGGVFKYIMAVDEEGKILIPATPILSYDIEAFSSNGEPVNPYQDGRGDTEDGGSSPNDNPIPAPVGPLDGPCAIALSDNGGSINYYLLTTQGSVFKFDVPKSTLVATTALPKAILKRTAETKTRDFRTLQATQHVSNRFLAMIAGNIGKDTNCSGNVCLDSIVGTFDSFGFNADGTVKKKGHDISPQIDGLAKVGSISADGLMSVANQEIGGGNFDDDSSCNVDDNDKAGDIFATPLSTSGKAAGPSIDVGNTKPQVGAVDISNEVTPGVRFIVYATRSSDTPNTQNGDDLVLQRVDSHTGAKIGGKHLLQEDIEMVTTFIQGVAVDPEGEFVIFSKRPINSIFNPTDCGGGGSGNNFDGKQVGNRDSLFFQAIDIRTGDAFGKPILLFSADDGPFDGQSDEDNSPPGGGNQEFAFPQINGIDIMIDE